MFKYQRLVLLFHLLRHPRQSGWQQFFRVLLLDQIFFVTVVISSGTFTPICNMQQAQIEAYLQIDNMSMARHAFFKGHI